MNGMQYEHTGKAGYIHMELPRVSQERLNELESRMKRCVCRYCGGNLKVRLIDFGSIETSNLEIFCEKCDRIEYGVEKEIYRDAVFFVDNIGFNYDPNRVDSELTRRFNIAKVCDIISWHDKQIGILDQNGYNIPIEYNESGLDCADGSIVMIGDVLLEDGVSYEQ